MKTLTSDIIAIKGDTKGIFIIFLAFKYFISSSGFREVILYRMHYSCRNIVILRYILSIFKSWFSRIEIPYSVKIGPGLTIPHPYNIVLAPQCKLGARVTIYQGVTIGVNFDKTKNGRVAAEIGDDVTICSGAQIIGPVTIGNKVIIGANSVVTTDISGNTIATGIPAKVIGVYEKRILQNIR